LQLSGKFSHEDEFAPSWHSGRFCRDMKRELIILSLTTILAVGFVGCASDDANRDSHKRSAGRYIDDKVLVTKVKGALGDSAVYKFPDVKVNTYNGTVQLTGFVDTMEQKRKAEEIARNVQGVAAVQNQIALKGETDRVRGTDVNRDGRIDTTTPPPPPK
jgi:hyperosmotically inducible protein